MAKAESERLMVNMDYSQVGLPRFYVQNETSQHSQEEMFNLKATIAELRRVQTELETSQAQFMEEVHAPPKEESNFKNRVDELAIAMADLANSMAELPKCSNLAHNT